MTLPFNSIIFGDRLRRDYRDIVELADSIAALGLIQPLTIDASNRLLAGGRRYTAIKQLIDTGRWSDSVEVPVHQRSDIDATMLDEAVAREIELEENLQRNDMTWQEHVAGIALIHRIRAKRARQDGATWTTALTGQLFRQSRSSVDNALALAAALERGDEEVRNAAGPTEALSILITRRARAATQLQQQRLNIAVAARAETPVAPATNSSPDNAIVPPTNAAALAAEQRLNRHEEACKRFLHVDDSIQYLLSMPFNSLDGVYCDPPYAIDDGNLDLKHMESTRAEHDRDENLALFEPTLRAIWHALKPASYAVLWCDIEHFTTHLRLAESIGFRVQRWPLDARKPIAENGAAGYNTTKDVEHLFVVAKPGATLATRRSTSAVPWLWADGEKARYLHPFKKPFSAHAHILQTFWSAGARIHDPFAGEGSSVLAGLQLGYNMTGSDKVLAHVERARQHYVTLFA